MAEGLAGVQRGLHVHPAARAGDSGRRPYVAFFPLRLINTIEKSDVLSEVRWRDVSLPTTQASFARPMQKQGHPAFARHIKQMHWRRFTLIMYGCRERRPITADALSSIGLNFYLCST